MPLLCSIFPLAFPHHMYSPATIYCLLSSLPTSLLCVDSHAKHWQRQQGGEYFHPISYYYYSNHFITLQSPSPATTAGLLLPWLALTVAVPHSYLLFTAHCFCTHLKLSWRDEILWGNVILLSFHSSHLSFWNSWPLYYNRRSSIIMRLCGGTVW